jgi:predicted dehydrogenase
VNVGIVGCGLIGEKRARALGGTDAHVVAACDTDESRARKLTGSSGGTLHATWEDLVRDKNVDAVIVATTNNWLAPVSAAAIRNGKHVLVEKPAAISVAEVDELIALAGKHKVAVQVGFNHRFHPALQHARKLVDEGALGDLMMIRGRYGHGGRIGYEKEWRAKKEIAGGGELIDQGVHLIDLSRWFLGEFTTVDGFAPTYFWDMEVDDNAFLSLRNAKGACAWLHASCTEWKNLFSFEIYGRVGKLHVDGLGGSYGVERLAFYKMLPEMGPPPTTIWEYPGADSSWVLEFKAFRDAIAGRPQQGGNLDDARAALRVVESVYQRGST